MPGGKPSHRAHRYTNSKKRRKLKQKVIAVWGLACFYCAKPLTQETVTMDHYWPSKLCCDFNLPGWLREHVSNKRPACIDCNNKKGDEIPGTMEDFWFWVRHQMELREVAQ